MGLLQWAQNRTQGYKGVNVKDYTKSWADGLAYCALLASYRPDLINFASLDASNPKANIALAYRAAKQIGIVELLDEEDFALEKLSMMTQLSEVYKFLEK